MENERLQTLTLCHTILIRQRQCDLSSCYQHSQAVRDAIDRKINLIAELAITATGRVNKTRVGLLGSEMAVVRLIVIAYKVRGRPSGPNC